MVNTIADKYNIPELVILAYVKFSERATVDWRSAAFAEAVEEIYDGSADVMRGLRERVVRICVDNSTELFVEPDEGQVSPQLRELANSVPCFSAGMASLMAKRLHQSAEGLAQKRATGKKESEEIMDLSPLLH